MDAVELAISKIVANSLNFYTTYIRNSYTL